MAAGQVFSTGSERLDGLLGGGYPTGKLVEVFGRSNTGKSQLAMQAVLFASRAGFKSLYVDTEGAFRPERIVEVAGERGWDTAGLLERVVYVRTNSSAEQMETVRKMAKRDETSGCRLVVVDTLTRNFTLELPGRSNLADRQGALDVHLSEMARDAFVYGRAYFLANRVTFGAEGDVSVGGKTLEQMVHMSVRLDREGRMVKATMGSKGASVSMEIGKAGVV